MSDAVRLDASDRMFNRLFWLKWISWLWALGFGLWAVWLIVQTVLNCLPGAQVMLDLPVSQDYPPHPGTLIYGGSAYVLQHTSVTFTRASMLVSHLAIRNVILLGLGQIFGTLTSAGIAWCIYLLVNRLRANEPFTDSTARALVAAGLILGIGSSLSTIATASGQLGLSIAYIPKYGDFSTLGNTDQFINFTPLIIAGVLFALAGVFRYGARLERERAELKRETEGLV